MQLTQTNLEKHGWLFSASLRLMVREHEAGRGKWDVEVDSYTNVNTTEDPRWDNDQKFFDSADTLAELVKANPELAATRDWVSGNSLTFF